MGDIKANPAVRTWRIGGHRIERVTWRSWTWTANGCGTTGHRTPWGAWWAWRGWEREWRNRPWGTSMAEPEGIGEDKR